MARQVEIVVDGATVGASKGESVAIAMVRSGRLLFGRSVKYHRPRGPVCFRARCEGCLMRVDGQPNVMTCKTPVRDGMVVTTQNVFGTANVDLLSLTDWFYRKGLDHHSMWTRFKPTNDLMKTIARKIAGVGTLPDSPYPAKPVREEEVDVLVIGAGYAGIAAANEATRAGARVMLIDEARRPGGEARLLADAGLTPERSDLVKLSPPVVYRPVSTAIGLFREAPDGSRLEGALTLVRNEGGDVSAVRSRRVVTATGVTGGALAFEGNDLPGVFTATGALVLLAEGIHPKRAAMVGEGPLLEAVGAHLEERGAKVLGPWPAEALEASGRNQVESVKVAGQEHAVDWVIAGAPPTAAGELAAQGGARIRWRDDGFFVEADEDGTTESELIFAAGSCCGRRDAEALFQAKAAGRAAGGGS